MLECVDCGGLVVVPLRHGVCAQCFSVYRISVRSPSQASTLERVSGASDLNLSRPAD